MNIGVDLDEEETSLLKIPPKLCIPATLKDNLFELEIKKMNAKLQYDGRNKSKEDFNEEKEEQKEREKESDADRTERERIEEVIEEIELETRKFFIIDRKQIDLRKTRATDMKNNKMIKLPPPLINLAEREIHVKREAFIKGFKD